MELRRDILTGAAHGIIDMLHVDRLAFGDVGACELERLGAARVGGQRDKTEKG